MPVEAFSQYSDAYLDVESILTDEEKHKFLERFFGINPHWRGAHVADILDTLYSSDSHLDITEPYWEFNDSHAAPGPKVTDLCMYCALYIDGSQEDVEVTWEHGKRLLLRYQVAQREATKNDGEQT